MTGNKKMLTLRVEVTISYGGKRPQRVRVVAKDRGALVFPYRRKLASIPLYKAGWRRLPGDLWRNEQAMAVPVDVDKLLTYKKLALQLYCLRGTDVKHKGVFNFRRLMAQHQQDDEVFLAMHYSARCWWHYLVHGRCRKAVPVPVVVRGGDGEERDRGAGDGSLADMWRGVPASGTPALSQASPLASVLPAPAVDAPATGAMEEQLGEPPPPRPVRFPDSGAVLPELLREQRLSGAEVRTRWQADEVAHQRGPRRHGRLALSVVGSLAVAAGTLVTGQDAPPVHWLLCGLAAALLLEYACTHLCVCRRSGRGRRRGLPAEGAAP